MTPAAFKAIRKSLWPSQAAAAWFFGKTDRMIRHYERGTVPVPQEMQILLRLMVAMKLTPEKVEEWIR